MPSATMKLQKCISCTKKWLYSPANCERSVKQAFGIELNTSQKVIILPMPGTSPGTIKSIMKNDLKAQSVGTLFLIFLNKLILFTRLLFKTNEAASVLLVTSVLCKIWDTCAFTVFGLIYSLEAIILLYNPFKKTKDIDFPW